jgi:hypothetical protein
LRLSIAALKQHKGNEGHQDQDDLSLCPWRALFSIGGRIGKALDPEAVAAAERAFGAIHDSDLTVHRVVDAPQRSPGEPYTPT